MLKKYTHEFKQSAVRQLETGKSLTAVARSFGINPATLYHWYQQSKAAPQTEAAPTDAAPVPNKQPVSAILILIEA